MITGVGQQRVDRAERLGQRVGQRVEALQGGADLLLVVGVVGERTVLRGRPQRDGTPVGLMRRLACA